MNRKYEFVEGDTITLDGRTLHRIRATQDIGRVARKGDLGGYIESESNLSDEAWVSGNARVFGHAKVFGNAEVFGDTEVSEYAKVSEYAMVYGNARVFGHAKVFGNAIVYGNARVFGHAKVSGNAMVYGNARVFGHAKVFGNAMVYGVAKVSGNAHVDKNNVFVASNVGSEAGILTVFTGASGGLLVTRGCFYGTDEEFLAQVRKKHGGTRYQTEYELLIQVARSRILGD